MLRFFFIINIYLLLRQLHVLRLLNMVMARILLIFKIKRILISKIELKEFLVFYQDKS